MTQKKTKTASKRRNSSSASSASSASSVAALANKATLSTGYWLMKSEPDTYSIDQLRRDKKTLWTGVRNYQARNFMTRSMRSGDQILFYHSNAEPSAAVGLGQILRTNLPDPTALDPKSEDFDPKASPDHPIWFCAEVGYVRHFKRPVSLAEMREEPRLSGMLLLKKGQRLSIQPVTRQEFKTILKLAERKVSAP